MIVMITKAKHEVDEDVEDDDDDDDDGSADPMLRLLWSRAQSSVQSSCFWVENSEVSYFESLQVPTLWGRCRDRTAEPYLQRT